MGNSLSLLKRIASGEVSVDRISISQQIMVALAFDDESIFPFDWASRSEQEKLARLDSEQIAAIKAYKQAQL